MTKSRVPLVAGAVAVIGILSIAAGSFQFPKDEASAAVVVAKAGDNDPAARRAFFGELHLHTGYSLDAYSLMAVRTTPDEAYRFARGEPITYLGQQVQRTRPLDFTAVTDHAEYLGALNQLDDPNSPLSMSELGKLIRNDPIKGWWTLQHMFVTQQKPPELGGAAAANAWKAEVDAANANYQPGKFTTFVAFEWSTMLDAKYNMHRNVIFRGAPPPMPFSSADSDRPEDLWSYIERLRAQGAEALAIPHNANASGGLMFDWKDSEGRPISEAYAQRRALNEPLTEIFQGKGQSETVPELSPNDEFANFEVIEKLLGGGPSAVNGSYVRQALGRGMAIQSKVGANPFKLGFAGGSDFHNGLTSADESAYAGQGEFSIVESTLPDRATAADILAPPPSARRGEVNLLHSSAGLTGVWAEANTRESIYAALRRRETFSTSGPAMRLRFFGGWNVPEGAMKSPGWVATAYRKYTPMGGDMPARATAASVPGFIIQSAKDPMSASLDRIQIVKVWLDRGEYREKVFDVVWSAGRKRDPKTGRVPPVPNTVNLKTATYSNAAGAATLSGVWRDPEFDPKAPAVYYARALEIPTPRWTTILAAKRNLPLSAKVPATIQERALSSPIWYTPPADNRRRPS